MKKTNRQMFIVWVLLLSMLFSACAVTPLGTETTPTTASETIQTTSPAQQDALLSTELTLIALTVGNTSEAAVTSAQAPECDFWSPEKVNPFQDENAPQTKTIVFDGVSYTGTYRRSVVLIPATYQADFYDFENGHFAVNAVTGKLDSFHLYNTEEGDKTLEECRQIAYEFAEQFVDLSDYQIEMGLSTFKPHFHFSRYIGDVETTDRFTIGVSTTGRVEIFSSTMLGSFDDRTSVLSANMENSVALLCSEQAEKVLEYKLQAIYADEFKKYPDSTFDYEIDNSVLVPLPDNTLGTLYTVSTIIVYPPEDGATNNSSFNHSSLQILIKCEPSSADEVA